jgi:hypothetical protein
MRQRGSRPAAASAAVPPRRSDSRSFYAAKQPVPARVGNCHGPGTYSPVLRQASLPDTITVPWWEGRTLRYQYD